MWINFVQGHPSAVLLQLLNSLVQNKPSEVNTEVDFMAGLTLASCQRPARARYKLHLDICTHLK